MPFDASCPDCKIPGDDCPLGIAHIFTFLYRNNMYTQCIMCFSYRFLQRCFKNIKIIILLNVLYIFFDKVNETIMSIYFEDVFNDNCKIKSLIFRKESTCKDILL